MRPTEAIGFVELVSQVCPQQSFGEFTPDLWGEVLAQFDLADCLLALDALARRTEWISPAVIAKEIHRARRDRASYQVLPPLPPELIDDPPAYRRALSAAWQEAAALPPIRQVPLIPLIRRAMAELAAA